MATNPLTNKEKNEIEAKSFFCPKCGRTKKGKDFYTSKNMEKHPNGGKVELCKDCYTMHVDNWDPDTFKPLLEDLDVPYVKEQWDTLLERYGKDPLLISGTSILGRYLSVMKLNQWKEYRWEDTDRIKQEKDDQNRMVMRAAGYEEDEIERLIAEDRTPKKPEITQYAENRWGTAAPVAQATNFAAAFSSSDEEDEIAGSLTDEDRTYLKLKWGRAYRPSEWVQLEQMYQDMMDSYDIQGAGHIDTLKLVCKTSLKANQLIDMGDIESYQKMSKAYDALMKSGRFTAVQNKGDNGSVVDSIGELVAICEKEGFIPRFCPDGPQDKADKVLDDMQHYVRTLVTEEMNLGNLIENSFKLIQEQLAREANTDVDDEDDDLPDYEDMFAERTEEDYEEFVEMDEEFEKIDNEYIESQL